MSVGVRDRIKRFTTCHREQGTIILWYKEGSSSLLTEHSLKEVGDISNKSSAGIKMQLQVCCVVGLKKPVACEENCITCMNRKNIY